MTGVTNNNNNNNNIVSTGISVFRIPSAMPSMSGPSQGQSGLSEVERVRTNFPETWLWLNKTVG